MDKPNTEQATDSILHDAPGVGERIERVRRLHELACRQAGEREVELYVRSADVLRVRFERPALVFEPGETFPFEVAPHLLDLDAGTTVQVRVELVEAIEGRVVWEAEQKLRVREDGIVVRVLVFSQRDVAIEAARRIRAYLNRL